MNCELQKQYTREKVQKVLQQMTPLKSLDPNGFGPCFYQFYWMLVGDEVCAIIINFHNEGVFDENINYTYIILISKIKDPMKPSDYRHINFCNIIYKIVSKILVNMLKKVLPTIISKSQSAFIL